MPDENKNAPSEGLTEPVQVEQQAVQVPTPTVVEAKVVPQAKVTTPPKPAPNAQLKSQAPLPTKVELLKKLNDLKDEALKNVGKPEHNAYQWIKKHITPLLVELNTLAPVTEEFVKTVASLKVDTTVEKPKLEDRSYKG